MKWKLIIWNRGISEGIVISQVFSWKILILLDVESSLMREIVLNFFNIIS